MSRRFRSRFLAGLTGAALLILGTGSAQAADSLRVRRNATRAARGAAVKVVVVVTCEAPIPPSPGGKRRPAPPPPPPPSLQVQVTQSQGKFVANGYGEADDVTCDGKAHKVPVWVTAYNRSFGKGVAFAQAELFDWFEYSPGESPSDERKITIR